MSFLGAGELHRRAGRQAALQDGPVGCTLKRAGGLHIKLGCRKGLAGGLPLSAGRPVLFRSPPDRPFVQPAGPPFCLLCSPPARRKFSFFIWKHSPPAHPARRLQFSVICVQVCCGWISQYKYCICMQHDPFSRSLANIIRAMRCIAIATIMKSIHQYYSIQ